MTSAFRFCKWLAKFRLKIRVALVSCVKNMSYINYQDIFHLGIYSAFISVYLCYLALLLPVKCEWFNTTLSLLSRNVFCFRAKWPPDNIISATNTECSFQLKDSVCKEKKKSLLSAEWRKAANGSAINVFKWSFSAWITFH